MARAGVDSERRRHPRFSVDLPIEYWKTSDLRSHPSRALNVSEGGLLIHLSEQLEIGQKLRLNLFISSSPALNPVEALVQVVWKDIHLAEEGGYRTGVRFVDISWKDMEELKNFLNPLLNSKPSQN
jgi:c-di-GMP-binding flagellar brake protein YcgR